MTQKIDMTAARAELEKIVQTNTPEIALIPFELLNKRNNRTTRLAANSNSPTPMDGANKWYEFEFNEPVFLNKIVVEEKNYGSFDEFEFRWVPLQGGELNETLSKSGEDSYEANINNLVTKVRFRPPKKWLYKPEIIRVRLIGFQRHELEDFVQLVGELDRYKQNAISETDRAIQSAEKANLEIVESTDQLMELKEDIDAKNQTVIDLGAKIASLTEQRQGLLDDITSRESLISSLDERLTQVNEKIAERTTQREALVNEVSSLKQRLRSLEDDVNMFPTEIAAFVSQGGQNINMYFWLAFMPISILVIITGLLLFNAADLTTVIDKSETVNIMSIFLTRLPFVLIAMGIVAASYKLARAFILEIMRINQQRLSLSKISIIATDASNTSQDGLSDLTDLQLYELRTDLKMQMLRDHLKEYLSSDFRYQAKSKNDWTRIIKERTSRKTADGLDVEAVDD